MNPKRATILLTLIWTLAAPVVLAGQQQCIPERSMPPMDVAGAPVDFPTLLDGLWNEMTTKVGRVTPDLGRPTFCFGWEPLVVATPQGFKRLLGTYDTVTARADILLTPTELGRDGICVIRHEMLHALLGHDEAQILAAQGCGVGVGGGM